MSTQQPGTGPVPEGTDGSQDDTQRLDPLPAPDDTQRLDPLPEPSAAGVHDGDTRVLPGEESGVDSLWSLDRPDDVAPDAAPATAPAPAASAAPEPPLTSAYPASPEPAAPQPARSGRRAVRVGTVVWGLVVAFCGVLALTVAGGASIDGGTVAIGVLAGAGVALVLGSIVTGVRRRDRS